MKKISTQTILLLIVIFQFIACKKKDDCLPPRLQVTSNQPVYEGNAIIFAIVSEPGVTFSWTGPDDFTSTEENPVINNATLAASGEYKVTARSGTCEKTETIDVQVMAPPPCTPANNTISFLNTMTFSSTEFGINSGGRYEFSGSGLQGGFYLEFYNEPLKQGNAVYELSTMNKNANNAFMQIDIGGVASNWQAVSGSVYFAIINDHPTVTFCDASFVNIQTSSAHDGSGKFTAN